MHIEQKQFGHSLKNPSLPKKNTGIIHIFPIWIYVMPFFFFSSNLKAWRVVKAHIIKHTHLISS